MTTDKSKVVYEATGTKDPGKVAHALMGAGAAGKGFFFAGLQQAIENAEDAGATEIYISIDRREKTIRLADNGGGFLKKNVDGFFSLMVSPKTGKAGQIGRNGSGRYFLLHFCQALTVFTRSDDFKSIVNFKLQQSDVEELLRKDSIKRDVMPCEKPVFWDLPTTGSMIVLDGIQDSIWSRIPTNRVIIADFGRQLKPSIAKKIFINGEPLKPRAVMGEVIERSFEDVAGLPGKNSIYLFIPEQRMSGEEVGLGAMNNVTTLREVVRQLPVELRELVPSELVQGRILGDIYVPELNKFRAHDGRSFTDELFAAPEMNALVIFLDAVVRPLINEAFAERQAEVDKEAQATAMESLCQTFRERWAVTEDDINHDTRGEGEGAGKKEDAPDGDKPDPEPPTDEPITITPRSLTCLPGTQQTFRATGKTKLLGKLRWEADESGGKVVPKVDLETVYTAGSVPGRYNLTVRHPTKPAVYRKVTIRIEADLALKISPIRTEVIQGESHTFRARNIEMTTSQDPEKITWEVSSLEGDKIKGLRLSSKTGSKVTVKLSEEVPCGDYLLVCWDAADPKLHRSQATFEVVEQPHEVGNFIKIEDMTYEVMPSAIRLHNPVELGEARILLTAPERAAHPTLEIDLDHPLVKGLKPGSELQIQVLLPDLIGAHLQRKMDQGDEPNLNDPATFRSRLTELRTTLLEASKAAAVLSPPFPPEEG